MKFFTIIAVCQSNSKRLLLVSVGSINIGQCIRYYNLLYAGEIGYNITCNIVTSSSLQARLMVLK